MSNQTAKDVIQGEICGMLQDMARGVDERGVTKGFVESMPDYFKPEDLRQACNELAEEFRVR